MKRKDSASQASHRPKGLKHRTKTHRQRSLKMDTVHYAHQAEHLRLQALTLNEEGQGVCRREDGLVVFVDGLLPSEIAEVELTLVKKRYAIGKLRRLLQISPHRQAVPCPHATDCGGCSLLPLQYEAQLPYKQGRVRECLEKIAGYSPEELARAEEAILGMTSSLSSTPVSEQKVDKEGRPQIADTESRTPPLTAFHYRSKLSYPYRYDPLSQKTHLGFFARRSHRLIPLSSCLLEPAGMEKVRQLVEDFCTQNQIPPYTEDGSAPPGALRHLVLRLSFAKKEIMLSLVMNDASRKQDLQNWASQLLKQNLTFGEFRLHSLHLIVQNEANNKILGEECHLLAGEAALEEVINGRRYLLSPLSFFQVNPLQTARLFQCVKEFAQLGPEDKIFDLYCGVGSIGLQLLDQQQQLLGIEIVPQAIENAISNAKLNGLAHQAHFLCGQAEVLGPQRIEAGDRADVLILDPPRKGCEPALLEAVLKMQPEKILYISCQPATLARDLRYLKQAYQLKHWRAVDLFPHSMHVETVVLLIRM